LESEQPATLETGMRFALILIWLTVLICFALSPFEVKAHLHSMGRLHDLYHWCAFAVTTMLFAWRSRSVLAHLAWLAAAVAVAFGTEILEYYRFHNPFEWHDVYVDCTGIGTGIAILAAAHLFSRGRHPGYSHSKDSI
jgi:hypothetical protein